MRVVYFSKGFTTHDFNFLQKLSHSAHEVFFMRLEKDVHADENINLPHNIRIINWEGTNVKLVGTKDLWFVRQKLREQLDSLKPDILHAGPIYPCGLLAALLGFKPLVVMSWGSDLLFDADQSVYCNKVTKFVLRSASTIVVDSSAGQSKALSMLGDQITHIVRFPWGVDLSIFRPRASQLSLRHNLGWYGNPIIISNRNWERIYGVDTVLKGFALALKKAPETRLLLLGDGSIASHINQVIKDLHIEHVVCLTGRVPQHQMAEYLSLADLYVSGSYKDGTSVSMLEAMACGIPPIVTDLPVNQEWIIEGWNGWLYEAEDAVGLAKKIVAAVIDRTKLFATGQAALSVVQQRADWNNNFQKLLDSYELLRSKSDAWKEPRN